MNLTTTSLNFYDSWRWLGDHPAFQDEIGHSYFSHCLDIHVAKINPHTGMVEDDLQKNTAVEIWLEAGCYNTEAEITDGVESGFCLGECCHDLDLDCGGVSFEEAICHLALLVKEHYGEYNDARWVARKAEFEVLRQTWHKQHPNAELDALLQGE